MSGQQGTEFRPEIDGLRAVAILLVAVFHFKLVPMGEAGFIGVDVFFVISGFLITRLLVRDLHAGRFSLTRFYLARFRRLMPALLATLVLYFAAAWFVFLPDQFAELSREALLTQVYLVNFYFWQTINYFGLRADAVPLLHMWSLAVEEQFYLLYPIFLLAVFKWARGALVPILIAGVAASFILGWWATGWKPVAAFYLLPTRAWELGAGAILALIYPRDRGGSAISTTLGILGAALIALALIIHHPLMPFPGWFAAMPVLGAVLLILSGAQSPTGRVLSTAPMLWLGRISYPLYLVHWPVIQLTRNSVEDVAYWHGWVGLVVSLFLADAIQRWIEEPIRTRKFLGSRKTLLAGLGGTTAVLIAFAAVGDRTGGIPTRFPPEAAQFLTYTQDTADEWLWCEMRDSGAQGPCPIGAEDGDVRVTILGDSHALSLIGAFDIWLSEQGIHGEHAYHHGCLPLSGVGGKDCLDLVSRTLSRVAASEHKQTLFIASAWRHAPSVYNGIRQEGQDADQAMRDALEATIRQVRDAGHTVVLVKPMHFSHTSVPEALARQIVWGREIEINSTRDEYLQTFSVILDAFDAAAVEDGVETISLIEDLCSTGICQSMLDGAPVFTDGSHVRYGLSDYFARQLDAAMSEKAD